VGFSVHGTRLADSLAPDRNCFALIRLGAALAVLVSHNIGIFAGNTKADPFYAWTGFTLGQHAVHVFFILSGVLVSLSLTRSTGLKDYMLARFLRIYPGFAACVLLTALVLGPLVTTLPVEGYLRDSGIFRYIVLTLGLVTAREPLPGVFSGNPFAGEVNLSLWTLKYEVLCYLALGGLAVVGLAGRDRKPIALTLILAGLFASYTFPNLVGEESLAENLRRFGLCFGLGALAFARREALVLSPWVLAVLVLAFGFSHGTRFSEPALVLGTAYATLVMATVGSGRAARFANRHDLSYGVYLYGWPVAQALLLIVPGTSLWALHVASAIVVIPLAALSWTFVEKPSLALRPRLEGWLAQVRGRASLVGRQPV